MPTKKTTKRKSVSTQKGQMYSKGAKYVSEHVFAETCHVSHGTSHRTIASDVNDRAGFNRWNQDGSRPEERLPTEHAGIILACQSVYRRIGMVRNIIDLMTDFAAEGLELQHTSKSQERFYRAWAEKVDLTGRAHDYMKLLMRDANVIVRRKEAFITQPVVKEMSKGVVTSIHMVDETKVSEQVEKIKKGKKQTNKRQIPWRYTFLSPVVVEKIGGEVGRFFGADALGMRIPAELARAIVSPKTDAEREFIKKLPPEVIASAKKNGTLVALDMDKIHVDYYKKDDWEDWGTPFLYGVLEDIMFKEKMRLADIAALDGVINVIRLWKLGKSDQQIMPAPAVVDKLVGILQNNVGGGVMDLVWDDMIDLQVEYPPTDKILGPEKYIGVNSDIVRGLGIPDSLIGGADLGTRNAQSAYVQLKTLVERLEYVRSRCIRWIRGELQLVADAMGFKKVPEINFGIMSLRDEAAEKQLVIQLLDRGIISAEKVSEVFGSNFMIELERMVNEQKFRDENDGVLERSNPYNRPFSLLEKQNEMDIKLEKVKQGGSSGGPGGDNGGGDNPSGDQPNNDGNNPSGRPPSTKDTKPRNERTPTTQSVLHIVADGLMDQIDNLVDSEYLDKNNAKNMRSLTKAQRSELDRTKRDFLSVLQPGDVLTKELMIERVAAAGEYSEHLETAFDLLVVDFTAATQKEPNTKERRMLTALAWANVAA